jgi:hypothetical protein
VGWLASSLCAAGSRRFLSRSLMNSSYFAVPGRGGASAGKPPAHCGIASVNPAASFSLMVPQAAAPHAISITATRRARWRGLMGICGVSQPCDVDLHAGCARSFPGGLVNSQAVGCASVLLEEASWVIAKGFRYLHTENAPVQSFHLPPKGVDDELWPRSR